MYIVNPFQINPPNKSQLVDTICYYSGPYYRN